MDLCSFEAETHTLKLKFDKKVTNPASGILLCR